MIIIMPDDWDYNQCSEPLNMSGSGHSVSSEPAGIDPAAAVRRVAEEITGKKFGKEKSRMGFL